MDRRIRIRHLLSALCGVLLLGLILTGPALAGGGPGPAPEYISFTPTSYALTPQGEVIVRGTITCTLPGSAALSVGVQQVAGHVVSDNPFDYQYDGLLVSGGNGTSVDCAASQSIDVSVTVAADAPRGFRPGAAQVALDFQTLAHDPATGYDYPADQFGVIDVTLTPGS